MCPVMPQLQVIITRTLAGTNRSRSAVGSENLGDKIHTVEQLHCVQKKTSTCFLVYL